MGRVTIQKAITKVIQQAVYEFYCDNCGRQLTTENNPPAHHYSNGSIVYVCRYNPNCNAFYREPKSGKWLYYIATNLTNNKTPSEEK